MELLDKNLEELFELCNHKFSLKTVLMIADQLIDNFEYIHFKNYLHRDIKPENFLLGQAKKCTQLYLIDFGLSKRYRDPRTHDHIPYRENKPIIGCAKFASINTHEGREQSRRDDLEALCYTLIYFLKGSLPWDRVTGKTQEEHYQKIKESKKMYTSEDLCQGLPHQFLQILNYCKGLKFTEKPDYVYIKNLIRQLFYEKGFTYDNVFDWLLIPMKFFRPVIHQQVPSESYKLLSDEEMQKIQEEVIEANDILLAGGTVNES